MAYGPAEDADTALADYQVAVPEGEALVEVTVTAADGTVRRYRVVVARAKDGVNTAPTGLPAISGTAEVGEELTVSADDIADGDGLENATFTYRWLADDGTVETAIAGATGESYKLTPADVGKTLKVRVTFTDDKDTVETLVSVATEAVAATVPLAPVDLAVAIGEGRERELTVSWTAPESNGGSEVTGYRVQWKSGTEAWDGSQTSTRQAVLSDPAATGHTIAGLANGTAYAVRVLAVNAAGDGAAAEAGATVQDRVAPVLTGAAVDGAVLTLTFSEALNQDSAPAGGFVRGDGGGHGAHGRRGCALAERGGADARLRRRVGRDGDGGLHGARGCRRQSAARRGGQCRGPPSRVRRRTNETEASNAAAPTGLPGNLGHGARWARS